MKRRPYRFRKPKQLGKYQVMFDMMPGKWISTGTDDEVERVIFAEKYLQKAIQTSDKQITLREFSKGFFDEDRYGTRDRDIQYGHRYDDQYYQKHDGHMRNYILPRFGDWLIDSITDVAIEDFFLNLKQYKTNRKVSDDLKNKIRATLEIVLQEAHRQGYVSHNVAKGMRKITTHPENPREPFSTEEMKTMFPDDDDRLERFWGSLMWSTYFLIMRDTGFRPGTVAGLQIENYHPDLHGLYTENSIHAATGELRHQIKTSHKGKKYQVGLLTAQTERFLVRLIEQCKKKKRTLLFISDKGNTITPYTSNKHFRLRIFSYIPLRGRTQYCLRHSFDTDLAGEITDERLNELMAHTKYRKDYDHRSAERILEQLQPIRDVLEKRRGSN